MLTKLFALLRRLFRGHIDVLNDSLESHKLAHYLDTAKTGRDSGLNNQPPADALAPDANEQAILNQFRNWGTELVRGCALLINQGLNRLTALRGQLAVSWLRAPYEATRPACEALKPLYCGQLVQQRINEQALERVVTAFKTDNKLHRPVQEPTARVLLMTILVLTLVLETVAGSFAFAPVSPYSFVGGIVEASAFSAMNLGIAYVAGNLGRGLNHVAFWIKGLTATVLCSWLIFTVYFTLLYTHYRTALAEQQDDAAAHAIMSVIHQPLALYDVHSILLGIASLAFAFSGFWCGYRSRDPYPGYDAKVSAHHHARDALLDTQEQFRETAFTIIEDNKQIVVARKETLADARQDYHETFGNVQSLLGVYAGKRGDLCLGYEHCINDYRHNVRNTLNPQRSLPVYFNDDPEALQLDALPVEVDTVEEAHAFYDELQLTATALEAEAVQVLNDFEYLNVEIGRDVHEFFRQCDQQAAVQSGNVALLPAESNVLRLVQDASEAVE